MKIITVLGTRPEIIKMSPLLSLFNKQFKHILVHTGQHYAYHLDRLFFEELDLREPDYALNVGSSDNLSQTTLMLEKMIPILNKERPDMIVVQGDTNSTLAGGLAACKSQINLVHVEAGCRSFNREMPEEYNRIIVDHCSDMLFAPHQDAVENLLKERISKDTIYMTGSTLTDACLRNIKIADKSDILKRLELKENDYIPVTIHRTENTDNITVLKNLILSLCRLSDNTTLVFPIHPRTKKALQLENIHLAKGMKVIDPVGYLDFLRLLSQARFVLTDSGGVQEEAAVLDVPALVLRNETEWMNFVRDGKNKLVGRETDKIVKEANKLIEDEAALRRMKQARTHLPIGAGRKILDLLDAFGKN